MNTEKLYDLAEKEKIHIHDFKMDNNFICSFEEENFILLKDKFETSLDEKMALSESLAYYYTNHVTNDSTPKEKASRQKAKATRHMILTHIPFDEFLEKLKQGLERWELAEHFEVTEELIEKAYTHYQHRIINGY